MSGKHHVGRHALRDQPNLKIESIVSIDVAVYNYKIYSLHLLD